MDIETLTALIAEEREDYQLPPYLSDDVISRALSHENSRLQQLRPDIIPAADTTGRFLVKMGAYYILCKKGNEFEQDYQQDILSWQLMAEGVSE